MNQDKLEVSQISMHEKIESHTFLNIHTKKRESYLEFGEIMMNDLKFRRSFTQNSLQIN